MGALSKGEDGGKDDEAGKECDEEVKGGDVGRRRGEVFRFRGVAAVGDEDGLSDAKREESLSHSKEIGAVGYLGEVGFEVEFDPLKASGKGERAADEDEDEEKEERHEDFAIPLDPLFYPPDDDHHGEDHKEGHVSEDIDGVGSESCEVRWDVKEVLDNVTEGPSPNDGVVGEDKKGGEDAQCPDGFPGRTGTDLIDGTDGVSLCVAPEGEFDENEGNAE